MIRNLIQKHLSKKHSLFNPANIVKRGSDGKNLAWKYAPAVPINWDLEDRNNLPGKRTLFFKDEKTDLISPVPPFNNDEEPQYQYFSEPERNEYYHWDISHRNAVNLGCNELSPFSEEKGIILNDFDDRVDYHPWCRHKCFIPYSPQRGLVWHWIRYFCVITASRLDTILYNGYYFNEEEIDRLAVILARNHLFEVINAITPQETFDYEQKVSDHIEDDHLWRGVLGEPFIKRALSERSDRKPIILEVGSIPIPKFQWIRVSLDGVDAIRGINYEMKSPRPLLRFFQTYPMDSFQCEELSEFQYSLKKKYPFTNPTMEQYRNQVDFLVYNQLKRDDNKKTYKQLYKAVDQFSFNDEEPFYAFGKEKYAPFGYAWKEEEKTSELGYYFYQTAVQDQIGVEATELVKWDCLTGSLKAIRVKRRNIMYDIAIELQKFWDQVHSYRVKNNVTFKDFYRKNADHLAELGNLD